MRSSAPTIVNVFICQSSHCLLSQPTCQAGRVGFVEEKGAFRFDRAVRFRKLGRDFLLAPGNFSVTVRPAAR
jgi:hypothetical protein